MTCTMESENVCCMKPQMRRFEGRETAVLDHSLLARASCSERC